MRMEEDEVSPRPRCRWRHLVSDARTYARAHLSRPVKGRLDVVSSLCAPVTVFTESLPSDSGDNMASQSVPMVTASTGMSTPGDDGDEVFMEQEEG